MAAPPPPPADDDGGAGGGRGLRTLVEVGVTVLAAGFVALLVLTFLVKPFRIPSGSMENTLRCGDRLLVNRLSTHFGSPSRGDVVVFHPPAAVDSRGNVHHDEFADTPPDRNGTAGSAGAPLEPADVNFVKRVVAVGGDTVEVRDQHAFVNGKAVKEPFLHPLAANVADTPNADFDAVKVPKGRLFLMGDHRDDSTDSRSFGTVPDSFVIGKAVLVYWPPSHLGGLPSKDAGGPGASAADPKCDESAGTTSDG